jgi:hypothetical protein
MNKNLRQHYRMILRSQDTKQAPMTCNERISEMVDKPND